MNESEHQANSGMPPEPDGAAEMRLLEALRAGDESALVALVDRDHGGLVRLAMVYVSRRARPSSHWAS